jgi:hypothetical protein
MNVVRSYFARIHSELAFDSAKNGTQTALLAHAGGAA